MICDLQADNGGIFNRLPVPFKLCFPAPYYCVFDNTCNSTLIDHIVKPNGPFSTCTREAVDVLQRRRQF